LNSIRISSKILTWGHILYQVLTFLKILESNLQGTSCDRAWTQVETTITKVGWTSKCKELTHFVFMLFEFISKGVPFYQITLIIMSSTFFKKKLCIELEVLSWSFQKQGFLLYEQVNSHLCNNLKTFVCKSYCWNFLYKGERCEGMLDLVGLVILQWIYETHI
jgi:hypothetical protein